MVEETDSLSLTRMMELADSDIWHADDIDNVEDAKLASEMLYVLKTTLKRQLRYASKEVEFGDHVREVLSHYSANANPATVEHLMDIEPKSNSEFGEVGASCKGPMEENVPNNEHTTRFFGMTAQTVWKHLLVMKWKLLQDSF